MASILTTIISLFIFAPILLFASILLINLVIKKNFRRSIRLAADVSTFFFIISIHFLIQAIWGGKWFFLSVVLVLILFGGYLVVKGAREGTIDFLKISKNIWRIAFLMSFVLYFLFLIIGLFSSAISSY